MIILYLIIFLDLTNYYYLGYIYIYIFNDGQLVLLIEIIYEIRNKVVFTIFMDNLFCNVLTIN
jgi:hypothetical protein